MHIVEPDFPTAGRAPVHIIGGRDFPSRSAPHRQLDRVEPTAGRPTIRRAGPLAALWFMVANGEGDLALAGRERAVQDLDLAVSDLKVLISPCAVAIDGPIVAVWTGATQQADGADGAGSLASLGSPPRGSSADRWAAGGRARLASCRAGPRAGLMGGDAALRAADARAEHGRDA